MGWRTFRGKRKIQGACRSHVRNAPWMLDPVAAAGEDAAGGGLSQRASGSECRLPMQQHRRSCCVLVPLMQENHAYFSGKSVVRSWYQGISARKARGLQVGITTTIGTAHAETSRMDFREIVRRLNASLGAAMVSAIAGAKDPKASYRWQKENGTVPSDASQARILLAHRAWMMVSDVDGEQVARQWFLGANPWLDEISPVEAIYQDRFKAVIDAAEAMSSGGYNG